MSFLTVPEADGSYQRLKDRMDNCSTYIERVNLLMENETNDWLERLDITYASSCKHDRLFEMYREQGFDYYKEKQYFGAVDCYTISIAFAKSKRTMSLGYADRSGALQRLGLHEAAKLDMKVAFEHRYPEKSSSELTRLLKETLLFTPSKFSACCISSEQDHITEYISNCIQVVNNERYGHHVVTTRNTQIGEILLVERALASVLRRNRTFYCSECLAFSYNLIPCDSCLDCYCNQKCKEKSFYNYHKYECQVMEFFLPARFDSSVYEISLALRITLLCIAGKASGFEPSDILDRPSRLKFDVAWMTCLIYTLLKIRTTYFMDFEHVEDRFKELYARSLQNVLTGSVMITRIDPTSLNRDKVVRYAKGFYLVFSMFNHSCYPNVFHYYDGSTLVVRALGTITQGDQLFVAYSHSYDRTPKYIRQEFFERHYFFTCTCIACTENWLEDPRNKDFYYVDSRHVMNVKISEDKDKLDKLIEKFVHQIKRLEKNAPARGLGCARRLLQECYQKLEFYGFVKGLPKPKLYVE